MHVHCTQKWISFSKQGEHVVLQGIGSPSSEINLHRPGRFTKFPIPCWITTSVPRKRCAWICPLNYPSPLSSHTLQPNKRPKVSYALNYYFLAPIRPNKTCCKGVLMGPMADVEWILILPLLQQKRHYTAARVLSISCRFVVKSSMYTNKNKSCFITDEDKWWVTQWDEIKWHTTNIHPSYN
jgi:hypothetical protein